MQNALNKHQGATAKLLAAPPESKAPDFTAEVSDLRHELAALKAHRATAPPTLISLKEVCELTSLSRTAINARRAAGTFPAAVPLGVKRIAFIRQEVLAWIAERIASRQEAA